MFSSRKFMKYDIFSHFHHTWSKVTYRSEFLCWINTPTSLDLFVKIKHFQEPVSTNKMETVSKIQLYWSVTVLNYTHGSKRLFIHRSYFKLIMFILWLFTYEVGDALRIKSAKSCHFLHENHNLLIHDDKRNHQVIRTNVHGEQTCKLIKWIDLDCGQMVIKQRYLPRKLNKVGIIGGNCFNVPVGWFEPCKKTEHFCICMWSIFFV